MNAHMYNKFDATIVEAYKQVELFNNIAGSLEHVTVEKLDNQLSYIYEELVETIDALERKDDKEFIDGIADVFVTVAGLIQIAEKAGYDVSEAINRVNANNLSKYLPYRKVDIVDFESIGNKYSLDEVQLKSASWYDREHQPPNTTAIENERFSVVVFKDANGKVKKPLNFVPVDLLGTYPNFLKGGD